MNNKKVIRRKNENGKFTTIHTSIINDNRLTSNSLRLLISVLSDNDETFNLSQQTYCNRFNWDKRIFFKAISNLEECGYLRKTEIDSEKSIPKLKKAGSNKKIYLYTISEYGNLKKEDPIQSEIQEAKQAKINLANYQDSLFTEFDKRQELGQSIDENGVTDYINKAYSDGKITSPEQLSVPNLNKIIDKFKIENKSIQQAVSNKRIDELIQTRSSGLSQKDLNSLRIKIKNRVKENPLMTEQEIGSKILAIKTEYRKQPVGNQD